MYCTDVRAKTPEAETMTSEERELLVVNENEDDPNALILPAKRRKSKTEDEEEEPVAQPKLNKKQLRRMLQLRVRYAL